MGFRGVKQQNVGTNISGEFMDNTNMKIRQSSMRTREENED
jgi:hypothetical protein